MQALIDLFWVKYGDLQRAIEREDERLTIDLDRELDPLMQAIFGSEQRDTTSMQAQFRFALDLLKEEADDHSCVRRNAHLLQTLVERYLSPRKEDASVVNSDVDPSGEGVGDVIGDGILDDSLLNQLSERVMVVAPSYRVLYSNETNGRRFGQPRENLIGTHLAEMVGLHRFRNEFKGGLDACFAGESVVVTYADQIDGKTIVMRCRMSPFWRSSTLIGALVVIQETEDRRKRASD